MSKNSRIAVRLTQHERDSIDLLVRAGRYKNLTQFVRHAINGYLEIQDLEAARIFVKKLEKKVDEWRKSDE